MGPCWGVEVSAVVNGRASAIASAVAFGGSSVHATGTNRRSQGCSVRLASQ